MLQFYFFSILFNTLTGISLITLKKKNGEPLVEKPIELFENPTYKLILGILTGFMGLMKLLSVVPNDVPIFGDFIPFVAGILGAAVLLFDYNNEKNAVSIAIPSGVENLLVKGRVFVGYFCIAAGVLHLLFPKVIFF
ncbi:MAG TPA: hypothetical protein VLZ44_05190 [Treponemataceae bacterium]|jgi:membrane protein YqaA with SNARE-associated domain|nr:hypothetical protein [Treponemataceae bacterium]